MTNKQPVRHRATIVGAILLFLGTSAAVYALSTKSSETRAVTEEVLDAPPPGERRSSDEANLRSSVEEMNRRLRAIERQQTSTLPNDPTSVAAEQADEDADEQAAPPAIHSDDEAVAVALEDVFSNLPRAEATTQARFAELQGAMTRLSHLSAGTTVDDMSCSDVACRVAITHDGDESAERFRNSLHRMFSWAQVGHITDDGNNSVVYVTSEPTLVSGILLN